MSFSSVSYMMVLVFFMVLVTSVAAREFHVGGHAGGWNIPSSPSESLNMWAAKQRFQVGDILVFTYKAKADTVLVVPKKQYDGCIKNQDIISAHDAGITKIELNKPGHYYFVSGTDDHCEKGQKLEVVVLAQQHKGASPLPAPAPASMPLPMTPGPAVHKHSGAFGSRAGLVGVLMGLGFLAGMF